MCKEPAPNCTRSNAPLTAHHILVSCANYNTNRSRFNDICEGRISRKQMTLMKDVSLKNTSAQGKFLYYKLQDISYDEVFEKYVADPQLLDYVACFTGPIMSAMTSMVVNKPPDSGKLTSRHPLHQDLHYFTFRPVDRIVATWTAMEHISDDNGCLVVIPGTHKCQLLQHDYPDWEGGVNKGFHEVRGFGLVPTLKLHMDKGDTVFFHPLLIHGSGPNLSKGFRKAISCHYTTADYHQIDVTGTCQEAVAKEIEEVALRRGIRVTVHGFWDMNSRVFRRPPRSAL